MGPQTGVNSPSGLSSRSAAALTRMLRPMNSVCMQDNVGKQDALGSKSEEGWAGTVLQPRDKLTDRAALSLRVTMLS